MLSHSLIRYHVTFPETNYLMLQTENKSDFQATSESKEKESKKKRGGGGGG